MDDPAARRPRRAAPRRCRPRPARAHLRRARPPLGHAHPSAGRPFPASQSRGSRAVRSRTVMSHRVLIIDDEAGIRQALKQVLEYEGMEVRVASSGGEGISAYGEFRPHLVFLDVKMAGLDGLETLTRLRDIDPAAVVIMIS